MENFIIVFVCFFGSWTCVSLLLYFRLKRLILSLSDDVKRRLEETVKAALHDYLGLNR